MSPPAPGNSGLLSVITTAYNERQNLPVLYERLSRALDEARIPWELIVVDDHSADGTFDVITEISARDARVRGVRLSRNVGSHSSIRCAIENARGACLVQIAADLQDPPEIIPELWRRWTSGAQIVWAVRRKREGERARVTGFAKLYYFIMRHVVGLKELAATGADFYAMDRRVAQAVLQCGEHNTNLFALIAWMGFRQDTLLYDRQARLHGRSGWSLEKKLKLVIDSITAFTYLPVRLMSYAGLVIAFLGLLYASFVVYNAVVKGISVQGWASLMVVLLVTAGVQMIMMGVVGEYVWRAFDESRRRPRFFVESATPPHAQEKESCKSQQNAF